MALREQRPVLVMPVERWDFSQRASNCGQVRLIHKKVTRHERVHGGIYIRSPIP